MLATDESPLVGEAGGDRLSRFSEASLRISQSLDSDTVLQEVIDSACSLTEARYGALITFDDSKGITDLITSGITTEEVQKLGDPPKGLGILGYLNEIEGPLRLTNIASHPRSVGFPKNHPPMKTFLGTPVRYQGKRLGNIYLTEKEGGREFSREDEDILALLASQAALAITNAHRHSEERQARADMEALVNISPVGVVVFDAKTGDLLSSNDETRRIVGKLDAPGRGLNQLLETITLTTPAGRDIPIDELPTTKALRTGKTVLADEVVIHLPNGQAVSTLVNARPIRGEDGEVASVVATIQDITALERMKSQRTEFLGRVSQELRTPLTAIKGSTATILGSPQPPGGVETRQFLRIIDEQADHMRSLINDLVDITQIEAGTLPVTLEPTDLEDLLEQAGVAFLQEGGGTHFELDLAPDLPRVMADRQRVYQMLGTLLKNASEHSPESSILVSASPEDLYVKVSVKTGDTSAPYNRFPGSSGVFPQVYGADTWTGSGRDALSLAVCRGIAEAHGGRLSAEIGGHGARFDFTLPAVDEAAHGGQDGSDPQSAHSRESGWPRARILVIEVDPEARRYIRNTLSEADFTPVVTGNPNEIEHLIEVEKPHLVVVEPTLPWGEEFELMERIHRTSDAPVVFVSGDGSGRNMERAFEYGVADYLVKPFTPTELVARIKAALRKHQTSVNESVKPFVLGDLTINYAQHQVKIAGSSVQLSATEYRLLLELSSAAGNVLTYEQLLRRAWGPLYSSDARVVRTYVKQLRRKLKDDARQPTYIFNKPRVGYYMPKPRERPEPTGD